MVRSFAHIGALYALAAEQLLIIACGCMPCCVSVLSSLCYVAVLAEFRGRIELIQDFDFPAASTRIKMSRDGQFIGVCGVYKPQIKVFECSQLSMKFERHAVTSAQHMKSQADTLSMRVVCTSGLLSSATPTLFCNVSHLHEQLPGCLAVLLLLAYSSASLFSLLSIAALDAPCLCVVRTLKLSIFNF